VSNSSLDLWRNKYLYFSKKRNKILVFKAIMFGDKTIIFYFWLLNMYYFQSSSVKMNF
jgi:hypothetical protein